MLRGEVEEVERLQKRRSVEIVAALAQVSHWTGRRLYQCSWLKVHVAGSMLALI
jgi:hypothetical protein